MKKAINATFLVKRVSKITGGFVMIVEINDSNKEFYGSQDRIVDNEAPFRFVGQRAGIMLSSHGVATINQLKKLVGLGKTTITFDAYEGKKGEKYTDLKGNEKEYTQDGWNLLSGSIKFSAVATATLDALADRVDEAVMVQSALAEFREMNGSAKATASVSVDAEEHVPNI